MSTRRAGAAPRSGPASEGLTVEDLAALLEGDQALYLRLGPEGAVISVKKPEAFAFGEAEGVRWHRMSSRERAKTALGWIRKAAQYCRRPRVRWMPV
ncbi:MAG: hypothetical protein JO332_02815 [Planctomycetaceae bacterium]|nr:hypothetical protein [Planctomycetaceae bacterium]